MATPNDETILIEVDINFEGLTLAELQKQIKATRTDLDTLVPSTEKFNQAAKKLGVLTNTFDQARKSIKATQADVGAVSGSLDALKNQQKALNAEISKVKIGTEQYKKLAGELVAVNEELSQQQRALKGTASLYEQVKGASKEAIQEAGGFAPIIGILQGGAAKVQGFIGSLKGIASGFTGIKGAIAASGIGAILLVLGAVSTFLTQTKKGVELLGAATAGLNAGFRVLVDQVSGIGEGIINAFTNPRKAIGEFVNYLQNEVTVRVQGLSDAFQALKKGDFGAAAAGLGKAAFGQFGQAVANATTQVVEATKAAVALTQAQFRLNDQVRQLNKDTAIQIGLAERLRATSADASKGIQARIDALKEAGRIEQQLLARQIAAANEQARIIKAQNALSDSSAEDLDKQAEAEIRAIELVNQARIKAAQLNSEIANLQKDQRQKQVEQFKAETDKIIAFEQAVGANVEATSEQRIQSAERVLSLQQRLATFAENTLGQQEEEKKILAEIQGQVAVFQQQVTNVTAAELAKREAAAKASAERVVALNRQTEELNVKTAQDGTAQQIALIQLQIRAVEEAAAKQLSVEGLAAAERIALQENTNAQLALLLKQLGDIQVAESTKTADKLRDNLNRLASSVSSSLSTFAQLGATISQNALKQAEAEASLADAAAQASQTRIDTLNGEINNASASRKRGLQQQLAAEKAVLERELAAKEAAAKRTQEINKQVAEAQKGVSIVQAIINTALGITKALSELPPPFSFIEAALIGAVGAAQVAVIASQSFAKGGILPSMAEGGISQGRSHAAGGIALVSGGAKVGEIEGGEAILTRGVVRNPSLLAAASAINIAGGGRPLGGSSYMATGGVVPEFGIAQPSLTTEVDRFIEAVREIQPVVSVRDIDLGQQRVQVLSNGRKI